ncbi:MAG: hypothetical protein CM1200mP27_02070 [Chloroflexota bacterium]|nr:MAG: hypothetical protein CM1200mP27_02070 [Chloroflexota bacterium]
MSVVGASLSKSHYLFRYGERLVQMAFPEEDRGKCHTKEEWIAQKRAQCWKLYPDIGVTMGVRSSIIELMNEDFTNLWDSVESLPNILTNGLPDEKTLLHQLWGEMGLMQKDYTRMGIRTFRE